MLKIVNRHEMMSIVVAANAHHWWKIQCYQCNGDSDQQLQLYAMTEGSCFTILTETCKMVVVQMAHIRSKSHVTYCEVP